MIVTFLEIFMLKEIILLSIYLCVLEKPTGVFLCIVTYLTLYQIILWVIQDCVETGIKLDQQIRRENKFLLQ